MAACTLIALPKAAVAAPPQCLTNLVANVFAGNPTTLPPAPCSDPDGDALTLILVSRPDHGVLGPQAADGTRIYTAAADYVGNDIVQFKASDGTSESAVSTLTINVQAPPNVPPQEPPPGETTQPIAQCDVYWQRLGYPLRVPAPGFLANDSDPQHLSLRAAVDDTNFAVADHPYRFSRSTGALWFSKVSKPFKTVITYHVVNSAGMSSEPAKITIYVQRERPGRAALDSCRKSPLGQFQTRVYCHMSVTTPTLSGNYTLSALGSIKCTSEVARLGIRICIEKFNGYWHNVAGGCRPSPYQYSWTVFPVTYAPGIIAHCRRGVPTRTVLYGEATALPPGNTASGSKASMSFTPRKCTL